MKLSAEHMTVGGGLSTASESMEPNALTPVPLVVDLDGTLTTGDLLVEGLLTILRRNPLRFVLVCSQALLGIAQLKRAVATTSPLDLSQVVFREDLLEYLHQQRVSGRRLVLATAADRHYADAIAQHLRLFDEVLATEPGRNLVGLAKASALKSRFPAGFLYAGDSRADLVVWGASSGALLVGPGKSLQSALPQGVPVVGQFGESAGTQRSLWYRQLRVQQWLKNSLVFVPLLTGDTGFGWQPLAAALLAFFAFSLLSSATYIVNDLLDLPADRSHPSKRTRPLASGQIGLKPALGASLICLLAAVAICNLLPSGFSLAIGAYWVLSTAYSLSLKRRVLLDVLVLAVLFTLRVVAGALALQITTSHWLLAFSGAVFLSLALAKRCSELKMFVQLGKSTISGRGYTADDLQVLVPLGIAAAVSAVLVFGLFISAPETLIRYAEPSGLWVVAFSLTYWLGRLWIDVARGHVQGDPLVYTLTQPACRAAIGCMVAASVVARFGWGANA
jgi:4-hydroxybenzoate polyprenyltransferase